MESLTSDLSSQRNEEEEDQDFDQSEENESKTTTLMSSLVQMVKPLSSSSNENSIAEQKELWKDCEQQGEQNSIDSICHGRSGYSSDSFYSAEEDFEDNGPISTPDKLYEVNLGFETVDNTTKNPIILPPVVNGSDMPCELDAKNNETFDTYEDTDSETDSKNPEQDQATSGIEEIRNKSKTLSKEVVLIYALVFAAIITLAVGLGVALTGREDGDVEDSSLHVPTISPYAGIPIDLPTEDWAGIPATAPFNTPSALWASEAIPAGSDVPTLVPQTVMPISPETAIWVPVGENINEVRSGDSFASSVSLSSNGRRMAISAANYDGGARVVDNGVVQVFDYDDSVDAWVLGANLFGWKNGEMFGYSISLSGNSRRIAIGSVSYDTDDDDATTEYKGEKYGLVTVFEFRSGTWGALGEPIQGDLVDESIVRSVSLSFSGDRLVIGSRDGGNGRVRIYENTSFGWEQIGKDIEGDSTDDSLGNMVQISDDGMIVAVGFQKKVRVYTYRGRYWVQRGTALSGLGDEDIVSVSMSSGDGSIIAIGDRAGNIQSIQYDKSKDSWNLFGTIDGPTSFEASDCTVALSSDGKTLATGAHGLTYDDEQRVAVRAFMYDESNGWAQAADDIEGNGSAAPVSLSENGRRIAVGVLGDGAMENSKGHVRVFDLVDIEHAPDHWREQFIVHT